MSSSSSYSSSCYCNCSIKYRVALFMTCSSNSQVFSVAVFSSETGQWRNSKLRFPDNLCFWHETSIGNNGIIYCRVGDTMLKGIVAFDPFKDDSEEEEEEQQQQRCRLISLPSEFSRGPVNGHSAEARLGVVRGRLRLVQFYFIKTSNTYALKAWELDGGDHNKASWDMVHHVLFRRKDKSVVLFPVALHPEDGDAVFLTSNPNGGIRVNDIFQYKIESGDDVELVFRCRSGSCVFPLVHPLWPTTIPSLPSST